MFGRIELVKVLGNLLIVVIFISNFILFIGFFLRKLSFYNYISNNSIVIYINIIILKFIFLN